MLLWLHLMRMDAAATYLFVLRPDDDGWDIVTDMWHQHVAKLRTKTADVSDRLHAFSCPAVVVSLVSTQRSCNDNSAGGQEVGGLFRRQDCALHIAHDVVQGQVAKAAFA